MFSQGLRHYFIGVLPSLMPRRAKNLFPLKAVVNPPHRPPGSSMRLRAAIKTNNRTLGGQLRAAERPTVKVGRPRRRRGGGR